MRQIICLTIVCSIVSVTLAGCSQKLRTEPISGTVLFDGQPLDGAIVSFSPKAEGLGIPAYGKTNSEGRYRIETHLGKVNAGTTKGEYVVTISKIVTEIAGYTRSVNPGMSGPVPIPKTVQLTPATYSGVATTPFTATVKRGRNEFNFELSSSTKP
jgi:hypothetical protein